jgi:hypothetical protein
MLNWYGPKRHFAQISLTINRSVTILSGHPYHRV